MKRRAFLALLAAGATVGVPAFAVEDGPPWLGIAMDSGSDVGVRIEQVMRGSPAERGGLRVGDRIVEIEGTRVTAPAQVSRNVAARKIGDTITIAIERTGTALRMPVVLVARPSNDDLLRMHLVGAPAPAWSKVTVPAGAPASIAALRGRVVLLDFWATWCGPCRMIAPRLSALKDRLGAQGLSVVGITTDEPEVAAVFAGRHNMRYPSIVDGAGETSRAYAIAGLPTLVLVDKAGVVRDVTVGFDPSSEGRLESAIKKLLAEAAPKL
jgi:thiol-disulfide isomerase/thioredoxin